MGNRPWFEDLRRRLIRHGLPHGYVRRFMEEVTDHLEDLREKTMKSEAEAYARLGQSEQVAEAAVVAYRHHPLYGREVTVIRHCRGDSIDGVMITLPDQTPCVLPAWMLDSERCAALMDCPHPRMSLAALQTLRELLQSQSLSSPAAVEHADVSRSLQGEHDASDISSSKNDSVGSKRSVAATSRGKSRSVRTAPGGAVSRHRTTPAKRKDGNR